MPRSQYGGLLFLDDEVQSQHALIMMEDSVYVGTDRRGGVPVLKCTRVKVAQVLAEIADGRSVNEVCEDMRLNVRDVRRVLYALSIALDQSC